MKLPDNVLNAHIGVGIYIIEFFRGENGHRYGTRYNNHNRTRAEDMRQLQEDIDAGDPEAIRIGEEFLAYLVKRRLTT